MARKSVTQSQWAGRLENLGRWPFKIKFYFRLTDRGQTDDCQIVGGWGGQGDVVGTG